MEKVVQLDTRDDIDADMSHKVLIESLEVAIERRGCRGFIGLDKFEQPPELLRRATSRHDDGRIASVGSGRLDDERDNRVAETVQVLNANEPRPAGCNH